MGSCTVIVRPMNANEIDITVNLFGYYRDDAIQALPHIEQEYDVNSVIDTIRTYNSYNEYTWLNMYEGSRPVGLIAGCITAAPWNQTVLTAHIDMIFLLPTHRNLENFKQLYTSFEQWATAIGCKKISAGDIGINPSRTIKVYEHLGFTQGVWMEQELSE